MTRRLGRKGYKSLASNGFYQAICRGMTFTWFTFTLIWFWSNWGQIASIRAELGGKAVWAVWLVIFAGATILLAAWETIRAWTIGLRFEGAPVVYSQYWRTACCAALVVVVVAVTLLLDQSAPDVVYKAF